MVSLHMVNILHSFNLICCISFASLLTLCMFHYDSRFSLVFDLTFSDSCNSDVNKTDSLIIPDDGRFTLVQHD